MKVELVVSAYDKDLQWLSEVSENIKITVYRKGDLLFYPGEIKIDRNIGRDIHTFFYHIVKNYDSMSDYTFFSQDYPFDHFEDIIEVVNNGSFLSDYTLNIDDYYGFHYNTIGEINRTSNRMEGGSMWKMKPSTIGKGESLFCNSNGLPHDHNKNINVDKYWNILFKGPAPNEYEFIPGGHFCVSNNCVSVRKKEFYEKILELLETDDHAPWVFERIECYIFNKNFESKI